jgi:hypothetical protein
VTPHMCVGWAGWTPCKVRSPPCVSVIHPVPIQPSQSQMNPSPFYVRLPRFF